MIGRTDIVALGATFGILALPPKKHGVRRRPWESSVGGRGAFEKMDIVRNFGGEMSGRVLGLG